MTTHENTTDSDTTGRGCVDYMKPLIDELAGRLVPDAFGAHNISQIWTNGDRILFRLEDGRSGGDIEILINWNCGTEAHAT